MKEIYSSIHPKDSIIDNSIINLRQQLLDAREPRKEALEFLNQRQEHKNYLDQFKENLRYATQLIAEEKKEENLETLVKSVQHPRDWPAKSKNAFYIASNKYLESSYFKDELTKIDKTTDKKTLLNYVKDYGFEIIKQYLGQGKGILGMTSISKHGPVEIPVNEALMSNIVLLGYTIDKLNKVINHELIHKANPPQPRWNEESWTRIVNGDEPMYTNT